MVSNTTDTDRYTWGYMYGHARMNKGADIKKKHAKINEIAWLD